MYCLGHLSFLKKRPWIGLSVRDLSLIVTCWMRGGGDKSESGIANTHSTKQNHPVLYPNGFGHPEMHIEAHWNDYGSDRCDCDAYCEEYCCATLTRFGLGLKHIIQQNSHFFFLTKCLVNGLDWSPDQSPTTESFLFLYFSFVINLKKWCQMKS